MKIKHEHIRMAMNAWAYPDGEKVPAAEIARTYFELGMTFPELYDDSHPKPWPVIPRKFSVGWIKTPLMLLKNAGSVTGDRKGDAAFAGGPYAQPQF